MRGGHTAERAAGFDILERAAPDEAMEVPAKHPMARIGAVELRPFAEDGPTRKMAHPTGDMSHKAKRGKGVEV